MEKTIFEAVYLFNDADGVAKIKVPVTSIKQINGWVLAMFDGNVVGGVKEEYLRAFYLKTF